jgi:hypothetical protein
MSLVTVLVVEDERIIAKGIEKQLTGLGYRVVGSPATGEEAVRAAADLRPDVVLMDIHLGAGMDGVEAAAAIRGSADVPVVFATAHSDDATLARAAAAEAFGYVVKPFEDTDLHTALQVGLFRHRAEKRVRENERWLAATLGSIGDGVIATDAAARVRFLNPLAQQLTGWSAADAAGADVREVFRIVNEHTREPVPNPAVIALERAAPVELAPNTILIDRAGGERPVDDSAAPIVDAAGRLAGAVLVFRDVTERRRLEEHLRHARKMETIGRLAGGIAHDFNNIMTVITGFSELLLSGPVPADFAAPLRHIHEAGLRAAQLTRQIMAFSRKQTLVTTTLNPNAVVRDTAELVRRLIGANIELVLRPAADVRWVRADPTQLGQVVLNLCANARDAMPNGGRLVVSTANADVGPDAAARHPDARPGPHVVLTFADTGTGMPPEVLARAFEPFFTTKEEGRGTGLGLASVHAVVKQAGGHVEVDTAVGAGTTFRVYLPAVEPPAKPKSDHPLPPALRGTETVLLVDDDELVRRMTRVMLEACGYAVLDAGTGDAAAAAAATAAGPIHLLITDLMLPGESGAAVAARLAAQRPGLRVLFVSGYNEDVIEHHHWTPDRADFLAKPFGLDSLATKVREVLDRA